MLLLFANIQDQLVDRKSHRMKYDLELHLMVQWYHLELKLIFNPIATKDKSRLRQVRYKGARRNKQHALHLGGGTRDLIIADWHDSENNVAFEVHVKRFKSKEIGIINVAGNIRLSMRRWFLET